MSDFQSLLPPNATVRERALEQAVTVYAGGFLAEVIAQSWDPATCPLHLLPWLAWGLAVESWQADWSEAVKRSVVSTAIAQHRVRGTVASIRRAVAAFGGQVAIREGHALTPPQPHTFQVVLSLAGENGAPPSAAMLNAIVDDIDRTKPLRSHFSFVLGIDLAAALFTGAWARPGVFARLELPEG